MDSTIPKKLEGSDIWEFQTLVNGIHYRLFALGGTLSSVRLSSQLMES